MLKLRLSMGGTKKDLFIKLLWPKAGLRETEDL